VFDEIFVRKFIAFRNKFFDEMYKLALEIALTKCFGTNFFFFEQFCCTLNCNFVLV
jgi:hypothetical protein